MNRQQSLSTGTVVTAVPGDWRLRAACRRSDPSVFFGPDGERSRDRARREDRARRICQVCPVLVTCGNHALTTGERHGLWGGMTEADRRSTRRRQRKRIRCLPLASLPAARTAGGHAF
ncbi:WhiB family transcriptional regulator (plasmid) [Rhodococcus sp. ZPP]|nr:WhiB family transcriptional regulator [Rhodococcus sp. ZPP]QTJ70541.1 WhiB family transcriptional regulator [Rhodococcus sp. ZPP]